MIRAGTLIALSCAGLFGALMVNLSLTAMLIACGALLVAAMSERCGSRKGPIGATSRRARAIWLKNVSTQTCDGSNAAINPTG